jgi:hypothetical protein
MENKVIYNLFTDSEIQDIYKAIEAVAEKTNIQDFLGRTRLDYENPDIHKLPESISKKVLSIAREINPRLNLFYFTYVEYNNKWGTPRLGPHKDETGLPLTINCQLESNAKWDLYVEGKAYSLEDNSALILNVRDQDHWRPEKKFSDDEFIRMLFFHFEDPEDTRENIVTPEQLEEINEKWKHLVYIDTEYKK